MNEIISWEAREYEFSHKKADWFWVLGIISVSIAVVAILFNNILFAVLILLGAFTLAMLGARPPKTLKVTVHNRGISIGKTYYPYPTLETFWVDVHSRTPKLLLKSKKLLGPLIVVLIDDIDPEVVFDTIEEYLPAEEMYETPLQKLMEYFGF